MAKKKKPAANPARGFATTSIASKPKPETNTEKETRDAPPSENANVESIKPLQEDRVADPQSSKEKELHELTPDELTEQLEHHELQLLVDNYGPKVRREVSRLDSKLRSDSRVLRSQAQDVCVRKWLPEELMSEIFDVIRKEREDARKVPVQSGARNTSEDDLLFRCWTLWEALLDFGIPLESVKNAVSAVIDSPPPDEPGGYIWGFRESIDLLALELEEEQLPSYDTRKSRAALQNIVASNDNSAINTTAESIEATPESSPR